jgi:hypothetical protein
MVIKRKTFLITSLAAVAATLKHGREIRLCSRSPNIYATKVRYMCVSCGLFKDNVRYLNPGPFEYGAGVQPVMSC